MTKRAVIIGLLAAAFLGGFTYINDHVVKQAYFIGNYMPHGVYGLLILALLGVNPLLARAREGWSLTGSETAVVLALAFAACAVPNSGLMRFFTNAMMIPHQYVKTKHNWRRQNVMEMVPGYMLAGTPPHFRANDFVSPGQICTSLTAGAGTQTPALKRVWELLGSEHQRAIEAVAGSVDDKGTTATLAAALNSILSRADLFDAAAFPDLTLPDQANLILQHAGLHDPAAALPASASQVPDLLSAPHVRTEHVETFNRHLLDSIWPEAIHSHVRQRHEEVSSFWLGTNRDGGRVALTGVPWSAWRRPLSFWLPLFLVLSVGVVGLSLVVHRQWSQHELLPYPMVKFAQSLLPDKEHANGSVFRSHAFRWSFGAVLCINILNYGHAVWPAYLVRVPMTFDFNSLRPAFPVFDTPVAGWAIFSVRVYPIAVGMAYLVRSDVALSVAIAAPLRFVVVAVLGAYGITVYGGAGGGLYSGSLPQLFTMGAYLAFLVQILYTGRRYYRGVLKRAAGLSADEAIGEEAVWGGRMFAVSTVVFALYLTTAGVDWQLAALYTFLTFTLFLVMSRVVAETGVFFYMAGWYPGAALLGLMGAGAIGPDTAIIMFMFSNVMLVRPREALMPFLVGALKLVDDRGVQIGRTAACCCLAVVLAIGIAVPVTLMYQHGGGPDRRDGWGTGAVPRYPFDKAAHMKQRLRNQNRLEKVESVEGFARFSEITVEPPTALMFLAGAAAVGLLSAIRLRLSKWPLHPILVILFWVQSSVLLWHSFLVGWALRTAVNRYGGERGYKRCLPLMLGLIAGDLVGLLIPGLIGIAYYMATGQRLPSVPMID